jgi:hypothetical protein
VTSSIAEALGLNGGQVFPAGPVQPFGAAGGR